MQIKDGNNNLTIMIKKRGFFVCQIFPRRDFVSSPARILCLLQNISSFDVLSQQRSLQWNDEDRRRDSDTEVCNLVPMHGL